MNIYDTDTKKLTCTCKDWEEVRKYLRFMIKKNKVCV
ncbi:MAG: hypothetical protein QG567_1669 [Campylobacterota bacterium]|nr:hypothetical protein [Campylobacterota bacterium]